MANELFQKMAQSIIDEDSDVAVELAKQAIAQGIDPLVAISNGFVIGVNKVREVIEALEKSWYPRVGKSHGRWCAGDS